MSDYYDHDDDGRTAQYLNVLFDAFGYNQRQYTLSEPFTSVEADEALQDAGLVDENHYGVFFTWWSREGRWYIKQSGMRVSESVYRFDPEAFERVEDLDGEVA